MSYLPLFPYKRTVLCKTTSIFYLSNILFYITGPPPTSTKTTKFALSFRVWCNFLLCILFLLLVGNWTPWWVLYTLNKLQLGSCLEISWNCCTDKQTKYILSLRGGPKDYFVETKSIYILWWYSAGPKRLFPVLTTLEGGRQ